MMVDAPNLVLRRFHVIRHISHVSLVDLRSIVRSVELTAGTGTGVAYEINWNNEMSKCLKSDTPLGPIGADGRGDLVLAVHTSKNLALPNSCKG